MFIPFFGKTLFVETGMEELMIGKTISHYNILEKLGEGGMGVVYKAEDIKLKREVALKFLPHHLTASETERARFIQESQAAATLNHPNICTIHAIEETGHDQFIVMEYVDGITLREKFSRAPITVKEAVAYAIQIGEALEEAHGNGIVHRDIKSDNIMVNKKNQIKVMDFGLAKLKGSLKLTKAASTVGTLGYMAPEQIQGADSDHRSDIFSFGVVLFEMLTGHLPFRGEHDAALMYSILNEEPESLQKFVPDASGEILHVLNSALEKQPEERYQTVAEMVRDLRRTQKQTSRVSRVMEAQPDTREQQGVMTIKKKDRRTLYLASMAGLLIVAAAIFLLLSQSSVELNPDMTIQVLDIPFTEIQYPGLSPDGKWLAFPAADAKGRWDIYNMHASSGEAKRITNDSSGFLSGSFSANISPDGSLIAYNLLNSETGKSEIRLVSVLGGMSRVVAGGGVIAKWKPDDGRIGFVRVSNPFTIGAYPSSSGWKELWTVRPDGKDPRLEFIDSVGNRSGTFSYSWSPDGKSIAWLRTFEDFSQEVILRELETGKERQLTFEGANVDEVCWTSNNQIIYSSNKSGNTTLWMMPAKGGESVQITKEGPDLGMTLSADSRRLVFYRRRTLGFIWRAGIDGSYPKQLTFENRRVQLARSSPNGNQVVFSGGLDEFGINYGIYLMDRDGQGRREIVPPTESNFAPLWSPDGKWIAYYSWTAGSPVDSSNVFLLEAPHFGSPRQITKGRTLVWVGPRTLLVVRGSRTWQVDIFAKDEKPFFEDSTYAFPAHGEMFICYLDLRPETRGVWMVPVNSQGERSGKANLILSSNEPGTSYFSDNRAMYLLWDDHGTLWKVLFPSGRRERVPATLPGLTRASTVKLSYDEKEILYVQRRLDARLVMIDNLFN